MVLQDTSASRNGRIPEHGAGGTSGPGEPSETGGPPDSEGTLGAAPWSILVVGAASRDVTPDDPRGWRLGGAACYAALTLAGLGLPVRALIGVDAFAAESIELDLLRQAGVALQLAPLGRGPVFRNDERPAGREQVAIEIADRLPVSALPPGWNESRALIANPIASELGDDWLDVIPDAVHLAVGWQGLLRELVAGEPVRHRSPHPSPLLRRAELVSLSRSDVDPTTPIASLERLVGPETSLLITDADRGGLLGEPAGLPGRRRWRTYPAIPADRVVDPTGAGDVFLAALVAVRMAPELLDGPPGPGADLRFAAAAASLSVEAPGLAGVPGLPALRRRSAEATIRLRGSRPSA